MRWDRKGQIWKPPGTADWMHSGGMVPTPFLAGPQTLRIFAGFRDPGGVGRIGYVDVDPSNPSQIHAVSDLPILDIGVPGAFDDNGVLPISVVEHDGLLYLYYVGFQIGVKVRFTQFCGIARSSDKGLSFERVQRVPVIDRSDAELFGRAGAYVMRDDNRWKMWYLSAEEWGLVDGKAVPTYKMKYLESDDLVRWGNQGRECMQLTDDEFGFARPFVVRDGQLWRMYYSTRSRSRGYRLGYAESHDGHSWTRMDAALGLDVAASGWDSQSILWPSVFEWSGRQFLFYNGNDLGATGFGYAELLSR